MSNDFTTASDLDSDTWFQLTEERVDNYGTVNFTSSLSLDDSTKGTLAMIGSNTANVYQFLPVDNVKGRYAIRNSVVGVRRQLSVCYREDEIADGKTQPCFATSNGADEQKWEVSYWSNSTDTEKYLRITNYHNGSKYWLDCHKGNPPFMSNQIDTSVYQPAQRWLIRSRSKINDGGFSTTFTNVPSSSTQSASATGTGTATDSGSSTTSASNASSASSTSTSSPDSSSSGSSNSGISTGAAAGIGIGVALGVIGLALVIFFFWWRRRNQSGGASGGSATELPAHGVAPGSDGTTDSQYSKPLHSATAWSMADSRKDNQSPYVVQSSPPPQSAIASEMSTDNTRHELEGGYQNPLGR